MVVRSVLIRGFASYLNERSHFTQFGKEYLILLMLPEVSRRVVNWEYFDHESDWSQIGTNRFRDQN